LTVWAVVVSVLNADEAEVHVAPEFVEYCTSYPLTALPPSKSGADQVTVALFAPAAAFGAGGASGVVATGPTGLTPLLGSLAAPGPAEFVAVTVKV
jgi:hypothetical protein